MQVDKKKQFIQKHNPYNVNTLLSDIIDFREYEVNNDSGGIYHALRCTKMLTK